MRRPAVVTWEKKFTSLKSTGDVPEPDIHANHVEADNASNRRKNICYWRKTNTYAKDTTALQRTLDRKWVSHNFIQPHYTTH